MPLFRFFGLSSCSRNRRRRNLTTETLESRALLSTFYVDGDYQGQQQDGSEAAPFNSMYQGIDAALRSPGDDTVIVQPRATVPYTRATAITPGYSPQQIRGYDVFDGDITIRGGGASRSDVVIDTGFGHGFFVNAPINVTIENLTVMQSGGAGIQNRSQQTVTVDDVHIKDHANSTGIVHQGADLIVRNSLLENNYQGLWSGSGQTELTPDHLTVENTTSRSNRFHGFIVVNSSGLQQFTNVVATENPFAGLRVNNSESVTITGGAFAENGRNGIVSNLNAETIIDGVTVENNGGLDSQYFPGGGGIHVRPGSPIPVSISNSIVRGNENWGNGGGIEIWAPQSDFLASAVISDSLVEGNAVRQFGSGSPNIGGGIAINGSSSLTLSKTVVTGNSARTGGGVFFSNRYFNNGTSPELIVSESTISDNDSIDGGGGLHVFNGTTSITSTTISGNSGWAGGGYFSVTGGDMTNVTVSGNTDSIYGGLFVQTRGELLIGNSTITENGGLRGGGLFSPTSTTTLVNSIVAGNFIDAGEEFRTAETAEDITGRFTSLGHNIFGEAEGVEIISDIPGSAPHSTDVFGTVAEPLDPRLGPLQDNGGTTLTHLPLVNSPAIDAGDATAPGVPAIDQRGVARPQRFGIEIGAVEVENNAPTVSVNDESVSADEGTAVVQTGTFGDIDGDSVNVSASSGDIILNGNGTWSWSLGTDDGPSDGTTVTVTATDQFGLTTSVDFTFVVNNVAPTAEVSGPTTTNKNEVVEVLLSASDVSAADTAAGFTYQIDWDSDGTVDETVDGSATESVNHVFSLPGIQTVTVTAMDKDGDVSSVATHSINVVQPITLSSKSSINLNSADKGNKTFQVVINSTAEFDVGAVDISTVEWAGAGVYRSSFKDVDKDGDLDLVLQFRLKDTDLIDRYRNAMATDSSTNRRNVEIELTGRTSTGHDILGTTSVDLFMTGRALRDLLNSL